MHWLYHRCYMDEHTTVQCQWFASELEYTITEYPYCFLILGKVDQYHQK